MARLVNPSFIIKRLASPLSPLISAHMSPRGVRIGCTVFLLETEVATLRFQRVCRMLFTHSNYTPDFFPVVCIGTNNWPHTPIVSISLPWPKGALNARIFKISFDLFILILNPTNQLSKYST